MVSPWGSIFFSFSGASRRGYVKKDDVLSPKNSKIAQKPSKITLFGPKKGDFSKFSALRADPEQNFTLYLGGLGLGPGDPPTQAGTHAPHPGRGSDFLKKKKKALPPALPVSNLISKKKPSLVGDKG